MSYLTLSFHRYSGLTCDLLVRGFHLNNFLTVLVSGILCTWPNQLSLWALIKLTIFLYFISLSNSSLVLIFHIWFSFVAPNILLKSYIYWNVHHLKSWIKIDQLDVTCSIMSLFNAQHVSNVSTSIFRSMRLIVDLFHVSYCSGSMCVGVTVWFGWGGVVSLCRLKQSKDAKSWRLSRLEIWRKF